MDEHTRRRLARVSKACEITPREQLLEIVAEIDEGREIDHIIIFAGKRAEERAAAYTWWQAGGFSTFEQAGLIDLCKQQFDAAGLTTDLT